MKPVILVVLALFLSWSPAVLPAEGEPITQAEWAVFLARGLGLEAALPEGTSAEQFISILGRGGYQKIEGEDYEEATPSLRKVEAPEHLPVSNQHWAEAVEESGAARYRFELPAGRRVTIRARGSGGPQFWSVNEGASVMVNPGEELQWEEVGSYNLEPGEQEIMVSIPAGGTLDVFELVSGGEPPIEPLGGFRPGEDLTYGDKAVTIVRGLGLENELPIDEGFYLIREAELYDRAEGDYRIARDRGQGPASRGEWVKPEAATRVSYDFTVPARGLYSILTRGFGQFEEEWFIDLGEARASVRPADIRKFSWYPVITVFLDAGPHTLEKRLRAGNGFDAFKIVRRRSGPGDYLQLIADLGFQEDSLPPSPERDRARRRRYQLYQSLEGRDFADVEGNPEVLADHRYGRPVSRGWVRPQNESVTLRYRVKVAEDGTYAVYMRSFGVSPISWKIGLAGESFRESREVFPRAHDAFLWDEVVTLDLEAGEYLVEMALPEETGLDVFEFRRRAWSTAELDRLAEQPVGREAARRNLEGIKEQTGPTPRPVRPEPTPLPEATPGPTPEDDTPIIPVPTPIPAPTPIPPPPTPLPPVPTPIPRPTFPPLSPFLP